MSPSKIFNNFFKKMYSKNMSMRTIIFFTIVIVTGSTMSGKENCCEQCCEYLGNCCNKGKEEVQEGRVLVNEGRMRHDCGCDDCCEVPEIQV